MKINQITKKNIKGDKIISVYWFAILFIVAGAVIYMVFLFYGKPYDFRKIESDILTTKISRCISEAGYIKDEIFEEGFKENFTGVCNLNFQVEDVYGWREQGQYFVEVEFLDFGSKQVLFSASEGNDNLKEFCDKKSKNLPICLDRNYYSLDKNGKKYQISILSIVRKTEKNA